MFSLVVIALAVASCSAHSISDVRRHHVQLARATATPPAGWATNYLENYETYHLRYLAIDCEAHHNGTSEDSFFNACCHPMLATETLAKNRPAYCAPGFKASSTSSASGPEETDSDSDDGDCESEGDDEDDSTTVVATSTHSPDAHHRDRAEDHQHDREEGRHDKHDREAHDHDHPHHSQGNDDVVHCGQIYLDLFFQLVHHWRIWHVVYPASVIRVFPAYFLIFRRGGVAGACGTVHSDSALIVALPTKAYANGANCGRTVEIVANGVTVQATVADECPTCTNNECLDMSEALFQKFAALSIGEIDIEYKYLN
ncbi:DPBB-1 domain-containing protein [Mycena chlorophos]|uniref:DPBB-1 domain-containing protein n=1 Tax=Mycena chlorophos TaxID=658473 RepID=A0A8H6WMU5_MYCCL|nr:DPBB-1 domain-containing protein [Mycena chlorophos]